MHTVHLYAAMSAAALARPSADWNCLPLLALALALASLAFLLRVRETVGLHPY